jgi:hypothetical protein
LLKVLEFLSKLELQNSTALVHLTVSLSKMSFIALNESFMVTKGRIA